jgi:hypothetical protein
MSAPAATTAWGGAFFRSAATVGSIGLAFDPDDGKDQQGSHVFAGSAIHGYARPPRRRIRRKFNDGAHIQLISLVTAPACVTPAAFEH